MVWFSSLHYDYYCLMSFMNMLGIPLLYSKPHFLNVHGSIRNLVNGIRPNTFVHESNLDVYPVILQYFQQFISNP